MRWCGKKLELQQYVKAPMVGAGMTHLGNCLLVEHA